MKHNFHLFRRILDFILKFTNMNFNCETLFFFMDALKVGPLNLCNYFWLQSLEKYKDVLVIKINFVIFQMLILVVLEIFVFFFRIHT